MKTRFAIIGIVIVLAVSLLTCELDLPGKGGGEEDLDLDWEFVDNPDGTAQLTLWLDGSTPVKATTANRALNLGIAKRSHDFFEAVFVIDDIVARSNWEIGQSAGIRGVPRGKSYHLVAGADGKAMVLVGRKDGVGQGTLLGVGFMTHVDGLPISGTSSNTTSDGKIAINARNVTFTVSALTTRVGYDFSFNDYTTTWGPSAAPNPLPPGMTTYPERDTFLTGAKTPGATTTPGFGETLIGTATFKNNATYSMFGLPNFDTTAASTKNVISAKYTVGGLVVSAADITAAGASDYTGPLDLAQYLFIADCGSNLTPPVPSFQITERLAIYQTMGQTYDVIEADLDTVTTVVPTAAYLTLTEPGKPFPPEIELNFNLFKDSGGAFAFTFQCPVYALAKDTAASPGPFPALSTNGGPEAIYWYIRPAHGQQQYLLDNGMTTGGMVLMGVGVGSLDWLSIIVKGFGFSNTPASPPAPVTP